MDQSQLIESHTITNSAGRHFEMKAAGDLKPGDTYLDAGTMRTAGSWALGCCVVAVIQEKRDAVLIYHEQHGHKLLHREEPVYLPLDGPVDAAPLQPEGVLEPAKLEAPPSAQTKTARISDLKEDLTEAEDLIAVALFGAVVDFDTIQKMAARALVAREALTELGVTPPKPRQSGFSDGEIDRAVSSAKSALEWIGSEVDRLQRDGGFALEWPASATALRSIRKDAFVEQIKTFRALAELCVQRYNERVQTPLTQQDLAELRRELDTTRA